MKEIARGAEAVVRVRDGNIVKERVEKGYRHPSLDDRLRRERTDLEARLMEKARRAGVRVPAVEREGDYTLVMDRVEGDVLRDVFTEERDSWGEVGDSVARLHGRSIIHGDLTTSNMILSDGKVYFIDFGLGFFSDRVEDRATDLHLLKEVLESTHTDVSEEAMGEILESYREFSGDAVEVLERYREIDERGRYK
ncbi:MAG: KEOPS complex kinase/ATPase Bud32 [Candidatus Nanohaloarchaea archaeon]|nr:KEOPS complex kinase/ATPase Bud32 [Candidatus Nanohaloarchaea archaeon]